MTKYEGLYSNIHTNQTGNQYVINNNNDINYYPNLNNEDNNNYNKQMKKVAFNNKVVVVNVESYKEHNKKLTYNYDEEFNQRIKELINECKNNSDFKECEEKDELEKIEELNSNYCCFII